MRTALQYIDHPDSAPAHPSTPGHGLSGAVDHAVAAAGLTRTSIDTSAHVERRSLVSRYGMAAISVGAAVLLRAAITGLLPGQITLITFYPAVMFSAWFGGFWPGVAATVASAFLANSLWLEPARSFGVSSTEDFFAMAAFIGVGLVISGLNESLHGVNRRESAARESADHANRLKDQFLAAVSHEVRAPINSILGWSDMLLKGTIEDTDRQRHALQAIQDNARRQSRLIEDLLDVARIASGHLHLESQPVDIADAIHGALDVVEPLAAVKHIVVTLDCSGRPAIVRGDPSRLQQIIWNLLVNAVKFTPHGGGVDVTMHCATDHVVISIRDSGRGIDSALLPVIFEPFHQAPDSPQLGGLGLGLSIVRQLVTAHGGKVSAESAGPDCGATFRVTLPLVNTVGTRG
jgi:signal transduction histidine kinase